jgi:hypothetical protein
MGIFWKCSEKLGRDAPAMSLMLGCLSAFVGFDVGLVMQGSVD